jgi:diguanylate cyclase (GGDEF)-like protein
VILPGIPEAGAAKVAEKIQAAIKSLQISHAGLSDADATLTISLGIASQFPAHGQSMENLVYQADQALYQAKAKGRNTYCIFNAE